ncbi:PTS sugar transporter subunit IIA [Lederbergia citri]|uniref:PTS sugar transporter subunit IIA n=1 Tax=Lederbergia citri TaxID=2833580 RepID=A0A942YGR4_9BACI|nr:PTS sugar transporter subunit IIA [Lederbergia citri]MBS4195782.1 PTS sugar transporter subunit IIA [Lederbergia citri]
MIGIVVIAHGGLAESIVKVVRVFAGDSPLLASVDLAPEAGPEDFFAKLTDVTKQVDIGKGVLVLVDLFGGTPGNCAMKLGVDRPDYKIVTGVNLPMLLEAVLNRENVTDVNELAQRVYQSSKEGIQLISIGNQ